MIEFMGGIGDQMLEKESMKIDQIPAFSTKWFLNCVLNGYNRWQKTWYLKNPIEGQ